MYWGRLWQSPTIYEPWFSPKETGKKDGFLFWISDPNTGHLGQERLTSSRQNHY